MTTRKYPAPLYAAAGASDYAYQRLRKLPAKVSQLRDRIAPPELDLRADLDRLRGLARENVQTALGEARAVYARLVRRGEQVVDGSTAEVVVPAKPAKRARPAAGK